MKLFSEFPRVEKGAEFQPFSWWSISAVINACRELSKALSDPTLRPLFTKITCFVWVMTQCWTHLLFSWLCPWSKSRIPLWLTSLFLFQSVPRARCRVMALSVTSHNCDCGHTSWPSFLPQQCAVSWVCCRWPAGRQRYQTIEALSNSGRLRWTRCGWSPTLTPSQLPSVYPSEPYKYYHFLCVSWYRKRLGSTDLTSLIFIFFLSKLGFLKISYTVIVRIKGLNAYEGALRAVMHLLGISLATER